MIVILEDVPRSTLIYLIIIVLLIIIGGLFSGTETAISYVNKIRIRTMAEDGNKRARRLLNIIEHFDKAIITLLILINVIHVAASALATVVAVSIWGDFGSVISTVVLTLLVFFFSETLPKNIAQANADSWSMIAAFTLQTFMVILTPFALLFEGITRFFKKYIFKESDQPTITEDEFQAAVDDVEGDGGLEPIEGKIIRSAVKFSEKTVKDVMTLREDIVGIDIKDSFEHITNVFLSNKYSRFPVYYGSIDNVIGVVRTKSFLMKIKNGEQPDIDSMMIKPFRVSPDTALNDIFEQMCRLRNHLAIVCDEDGTTLGLATMEDTLEVIVGEIYDEDERMEVQK